MKFSDFKDTPLRHILGLIHMYLFGASEPTVAYREPPFVGEHCFLINDFIRETPREKNIASECISTRATKYGCKILQLFEYNASMYRYNVNCE